MATQPVDPVEAEQSEVKEIDSRLSTIRTKRGLSQDEFKESNRRHVDRQIDEEEESPFKGILDKYLPPEEGERKQEPKPKQDNGNKESTNQEDRAEEGEDKGGSKDEEEVTEFDNLKLLTKAGTPVSAAVTESFDKLKGELKQLRKENKQLKETGNKSQPDNNLKAEYEALKKQHDEIKSRVDLEDYQNSEGFKEAYVKPIQNITARVLSFSESLDSGGKAEFNRGLSELSNLAVRGDENSFFAAVDNLSEEAGFTPSVSRQFTKKMEEFFERYQDYAKAFGEGQETRNRTVSARLAQMRKQELGSVDTRISQQIDHFMLEKKPVISNLPDEDRQQYEGRIKSTKDSITDDISAFALTGKVGENLLKVISAGITADSIAYEAKMAWLAYKTQKDHNEILKKELEGYKKNESKSNRGPSPSYIRESPKNGNKGAPKSLADALKQAMRS